MALMHKLTVTKPTEGRTIAVVGDVYRFLATGEDTNGKYALWEALVPPGGGPPPHVHSREEEGFYVLEGEITFPVGGERLVARAGTFANMPVGTPHSFKNESDQTGEDAHLRRPGRAGADVLRGRRAAGRRRDDRPAADEGRDREAAGGRTPLRHRDPVAARRLRRFHAWPEETIPKALRKIQVGNLSWSFGGLDAVTLRRFLR